MSVPQVYTAIANVMAKVAVEGISKDRQNVSQGYKFRGIDDVYNALSPLLAAEKLVILPKVTHREVVERRTKADTALFYVTVTVDFNFVSGIDGSGCIVTTFGEAMDSGDKATNKAMSAAFKYACMQAFCIPTEGDNDADANTHGGILPGATAGAGTPAAAPPAAPVDPRFVKMIADAKTLDGLRHAWEAMKPPQRTAHQALVNERKKQLTPDAPAK